MGRLCTAPVLRLDVRVTPPRFQHKSLCAAHLGVVDAESVHLERELEEVVVALGLRLGGHPRGPPDVDPMPTHQHRRGLGVLADGLPQRVR